MMSRTMTIAATALLLAVTAQAQQPRDFKPYMISDRATEVALARTAAPAAISDSATVLVLTATGYTEASKGTNGFTCLVARSFQGRIGDPNFWNPKVRAPHCFSPPAVRTVMPQMLKQAEWILAGLSTTEIQTRTSKAYASREFPAPAVGAMAYMTSPKQYLQDDAPQHWKPHLMFYYDRSLPGSSWGAGGMDATIIDGFAGDKNAPVETLLIPVQRWSDGTAAGAAASEHKH
ncbi:MAG: hypothetical protein ABJD11_12980 [Gemmatimonadota bacterium]